MAQTDERSTTVTPRWLVATAAALFILRLATVAAESSPVRVAANIGWTPVADFQSDAHWQTKPTLYVFRAAWCEPCKRMDERVFTNQQIANLIKTRFVPVEVTDRLKEEGKNSAKVAELEKKYRVFAFPTLVVAAPDGEMVASQVGATQALSTLHFLSRALKSN